MVSRKRKGGPVCRASHDYCREDLCHTWETQYCSLDHIEWVKTKGGAVADDVRRYIRSVVIDDDRCPWPVVSVHVGGHVPYWSEKRQAWTTGEQVHAILYNSARTELKKHEVKRIADKVEEVVPSFAKSERGIAELIAAYARLVA